MDHFFANLFSKWGVIVATNPKKVFWLSISFLVLMSLGMRKQEGFENERIAWTPAGTPSLEAGSRSAEMFPETGGIIGVLAEAKDGVDNIITLDGMRDIERFERMMKEITVYAENTTLNYDSICIKAGPACNPAKSPLTFLSN